MSGEFGTQRFGWDAPARISTSAVMLQEASEVLPETLHGPVGFMPSLINGDGTTAIGSGDDTNTQWKAFPDKLDLYWYQGDDIQIPLYFTNPLDTGLDMSNENGWSWTAQMRTRHRFYAYKVNDFVIESQAVPATPPATESGITLVTLFLPRQLNQFRGVFSWDLMSTGPFVGPSFPQPIDIEVWPPVDQVKTWLWGKVYVVPRVTATDWLPPPAAVPPSTAVVVTPQGWTVGPNGRVP
jgi:hypothetical protein